MMAQLCVGVQSWNEDEAGSRRPEAPAGFGKSQQLRQIRPLKTLKTLKNQEENLGMDPEGVNNFGLGWFLGWPGSTRGLPDGASPGWGDTSNPT